MLRIDPCTYTKCDSMSSVLPLERAESLANIFQVRFSMDYNKADSKWKSDCVCD